MTDKRDKRDARDENDLLTGVVPAPDAEPTAPERAHAKAFAELVDKTLAGRTPGVMPTDDRALLEVATVIRAASGNVELAQPRRRALIEDALRQAVGARALGTSGSIATIRKLEPSRWKRFAPWSIATVSTLVAAAAVLLWLRSPRVEVIEQSAELPLTQQSRPADPLVGPITREHAGDARSRIDTIFADRLDGYRELHFGRALR